MMIDWRGNRTRHMGRRRFAPDAWLDDKLLSHVDQIRIPDAVLVPSYQLIHCHTILPSNARERFSLLHYMADSL